MKKRVIKCKICSNTFDFTSKEQQLFAKNKWKSPRRCPECRKQIALKRQLMILFPYKQYAAINYKLF